LYNKPLINKLTKIRDVVKNLEHAPNSEEEKKYLQHLMKKYSGKHMAHIAKCNNGGKTYEQ